MKYSKGFTLIELLVVIAIIGILSAVVLASLNTARSKGNDAAVTANLDTVRTQSGIYYDSHSNSYNTTGNAFAVNCGVTGAATQPPNTLLSDPNISRALIAAYKANENQALQCNINDSGSNFAIAIPLATTNTYWCVDSTSSAQAKNSVNVPYNQLVGLVAGTALDGPLDYRCN
jgi:prepilin-type N-terminal cleavage/methylation domain-containing protein